ncbi:MAG: inositol monophosphatase family protein, partial [Nakamurella sp.]
ASAPALARRWWAAVGGGAFTVFRDGAPRRCRVSAVADPADASLAISDLAEWEAAGRLDQLLDLSRATWRLRGYGDFYPYMLVAEGAVDIAAEPELNVWDMAALVPIVTEAGGTFTGIDGKMAATDAGNALATNGLLHDAVATALAAR